MTRIDPTERTQVRRVPKNAVYIKEDIYAILDDGILCHIGFTVDGQPFVMPTIYVRIDDRIYFHGSSASRMLRTLGRGVSMCLAVTHMDGLVLARSAYNHSLNYRSVVAIGTATQVTEPDERMEALKALTDHIVLRRWDEVRPPSGLELRATALMSMALTEVSAKVRSGPPNDDDDYSLPVWACTIDIQTCLGQIVPDSRLHLSAPAF